MATRTLIMAVPWVPQRAVRAKALMEESGGEVVWDEDQNAFHTWQKVMTTAGEDPVVILEDDVYLDPSWREKVEAVIDEHPESVIQFFSLRTKTDLDKGSRWEPGRTFVMNQCYYLPAGVAAALLAHSRDWVERRPDDENAYDWLMAEWLQQTGQRYWLSVPSLVQHEPWRSEIHARRPRNRQSATFGQEPC